MGAVICPKCNRDNLRQGGNPENFHCPDCKKNFKLVEVLEEDVLEDLPSLEEVR